MSVLAAAWMSCLVLLTATDEVELVSGETLLGTVVEQTDALVVLEHAHLGRLEIARDSIRRLQVVQADDPAAAVAAQPVPAPQDAPPEATTPTNTAPAPALTQPRWKSRLELGFSAREGPSDDRSGRLSLSSDLKLPDLTTYKVDARFTLAGRGGSRTENRFTTGFRSQHPLPRSRWNLFGQGRYEYDEFQSWEHRLSGGGGVGYHLIDIDERRTDGVRGAWGAGPRAEGAADPKGRPGEWIDRFDLSLRVGGGFTREFGSGVDAFQPEGIFGAEIAWRLTRHQALTAGSTYFPNFADGNEFRVVSSAEWIVELNTLEGIKFKLGVSHEYQSRSTPKVAENDLILYSTLVIDF